MKNEFVILSDRAMFYTYNRDRNANDIFYIDIADIDRIKDIRWYKTGGYVRNGKYGSLHNFLLGRDCSNKKIVADHINGDKSDNRLSNLREVPISINVFNKKTSHGGLSKCPGVYRNNSAYFVRITKNKKVYHLGSYKNLKDAISARKDAEIKYYGELSCAHAL